jgi:hypothetical protein
MGVFRACPVPTVGPSAGLLKNQRAPVAAKKQRIFSDPAVFCEKPSRKQLRIQQLAGSTREIPCAAEQGINSTTTGNPAERPDAPDSRQIPSPSRIKLSTMGVA